MLYVVFTMYLLMKPWKLNHYISDNGITIFTALDADDKVNISQNKSCCDQN